MIVLNGKTLNSLPNQRLLFFGVFFFLVFGLFVFVCLFLDPSRVHSSEAEAALSFW